jgi:uncharacterized protein YciI
MKMNSFLFARRPLLSAMTGSLKKCNAFPCASFSGKATSQNTKTWLLEYHYVDNMLEKRTPFRAPHFEYTKKFVQDEVLLAGGALIPAVDRGLIFFRTNDKKLVEDFATNDPYVQAGLVKHWTVTEWMLVVGHEFFHGKKLP